MRHRAEHNSQANLPKYYFLQGEHNWHKTGNLAVGQGTTLLG